MKTVNLSEQSLKLIDTICTYAEKPEMLDDIAAALLYDAPELKRRLSVLKEEVEA